jgi:hypothetical protein
VEHSLCCLGAGELWWSAVSGGKVADSAVRRDIEDPICLASVLKRQWKAEAGQTVWWAGGAGWPFGQSRSRKEGGKAGGFAATHDGRKAGLLVAGGSPGRCGVSPLERVAAHDSSGEGKTFPLALQNKT